MTHTPAIPDVSEQQKIAAAFVGSVLESSAEPLLKAQADLLTRVESTVTDWLHRRHEAVADTQRLVARLRTSSDPTDLVKAQQDWVSGVFRRLAADAAAAQAATLHLVERSRGWAQQEAEVAQDIAPQAAEAARAEAKAVRVPAKTVQAAE